MTTDRKLADLTADRWLEAGRPILEHSNTLTHSDSNFKHRQTESKTCAVFAALISGFSIQNDVMSSRLVTDCLMSITPPEGQERMASLERRFQENRGQAVGVPLGYDC